ncbi:MAG TPA: LamG-like jellyroll fold domain-containing protein [Chitinispirillaceae bacterium]|nr:LamG-like jellyroll fold domain-containing protein [Chitinispirillaceae bacterium]
MDTLDGTSHCIVSKGFEQYYLRFTYISVASKLSPLWEFVEFSENDKWQTLSTSASEKQWAFIVGVRDGKKQFLYCNGVLVDTTLDLWPYPATRSTSNDLYIRRFAKQTSTSLEEGIFHFKGGIDEVRIISKVENPDWIKLCYMNQRDDDRLVVFQK